MADIKRKQRYAKETLTMETLEKISGGNMTWNGIKRYVQGNKSKLIWLVLASGFVVFEGFIRQGKDLCNLFSPNLDLSDLKLTDERIIWGSNVQKSSVQENKSSEPIGGYSDIYLIEIETDEDGMEIPGTRIVHYRQG